jgi:2,3-bisphosphoglycerate-independent phosphoglycerate mutase
MKYIVLIGDGMTDYPLPDHEGKTPLQLARTPNMDRIAREGVTGFAKTVPNGFPPGSDVANLSIFGYDPVKYYTGRAPLEAVSMGVPIGDLDTAFRCNLVTLRAGGNDVIMDDYSAGHISTEEAREFILAINEKLGSEDIQFFPGVSYRHLMVWKERDFSSLSLTPPHDITGRGIKEFLPKGSFAAEEIHALLNSSQMVLKAHPLNRTKEDKGGKPANSIWLWGQGKRPAMPTFRERFGLEGSVISAVDLLKGIGICAGFNSIDVPGATGYLDTNYQGKVDAALEALKEKDIVFLHVEAPDEAGHQGSFDLKIQALEEFDEKVVGKIFEGMKGFGDYRILLITDHSTPLSTRTHADDPVPFAIYPPIGERDAVEAFDERILKQGKLAIREGYRVVDIFLSGNV